MDIQSLGETVSVEDSVVQLAFDLSGSEAGYLIISGPATSAVDKDEFFGSGHYVEVKDQLFGRYGGVRTLTVLNDRALSVCLKIDVPGVGRDISIATADAMSGEMLGHLRQFERA